jgi:DNA-binding CsgD family transcriptional regulator
MVSRLLGREHELQSATRVVDAAWPGCWTTLLEGPPGAGKTRLWEALVQHSRGTSRHVLSCRPSVADSMVGFAALTDLFDGVPEDLLADLPGVQRMALARATLTSDESGSPVDPRAVGAAVLSVLRGLSSAGQIVVAVDDVQWVDASSARALEHAIRRIDADLGLLASRRTKPALTTGLDVPATARASGMLTIDVAPLDDRHIATLVHEGEPRLGPVASARVVDLAGGNPLFAAELALAGRRGDLGPDSARVPQSVRELVGARAASLPRSARFVLLAASMLRTRSIVTISDVAGVPLARAVAGLELAERESLVVVHKDLGEVRFRHPLYSAAVNDMAGADERRDLHQRASQLLSSAEERAWHLAAATTVPDADIADTLEAAAASARSRGSPELAASFARHAVRLTSPAERETRLRRTLVAADYDFHSGDVARAKSLAEDVLDQSDSPILQAAALRELGELTYHQDSFSEGVDLFTRSLALDSRDPAVVAQIELHLTFAVFTMGDYQRASGHARRALARAVESGDRFLQAQAMPVVALTDCFNGRPLDESAVREGLAWNDPTRVAPVPLRPSFLVGSIFVWEGRLGEALTLFSGVRDELIKAGLESDLQLLLPSVAWTLAWQGRLAEAQTCCEESIDIAERLGSPSGQCWGLAFSALVSAYRGHADETRERATRAKQLAEATGNQTATLWARWALAHLAITDGDPASALAETEPLWQAISQEGMLEPIRVVPVIERIDALLALDRSVEAADLCQMLLQAGRRSGRDWPVMIGSRGLAGVDAARGELRSALQHVELAASLADSVELKLEAARTVLVAGEIERRLRRWKSAERHLARAVEDFERAGALAWAQRARVELARARGVGEHEASLTPTQRRVAELVCSGLSNREVGLRLHISVRTVESNLARIYAQFDVHSRTQLAAYLAAIPDALR